MTKPAYDVARVMDNMGWLAELVDYMNDLGWEVYSFDVRINDRMHRRLAPATATARRSQIHVSPTQRAAAVVMKHTHVKISSGRVFLFRACVVYMACGSGG